MAIIFIIVSVAAAVVAKGTGLFVFAVINAVASFWSNGVMSNFSPREADDIPDLVTLVSMGTTLLGVVFLVVALLIK